MPRKKTRGFGRAPRASFGLGIRADARDFLRCYAFRVRSVEAEVGLARAELLIVEFRPEFEIPVLDLILEIQRNEFDIPISAEQQPDLGAIPTFYQVGDGNFWVALSEGAVVGTIALLDMGSSQAALRKMFVQKAFRGGQFGTAKRLLDTLVAWCEARGVREVLLGTTPKFLAAHRFYEKNGFHEISESELPSSFPVMEVDKKFYRRVFE